MTWYRLLVVVLVLAAFSGACAAPRQFSEVPRTEGAEVEECLIDFSQKMAAEPPASLSGLDAEKFFALLAPYADQDCLRKVRTYPVGVREYGRSYLLTVCDKHRQWVLFEDDGATLDKVDHAFVRDGVEVKCPLR
jgi:hypothetical protein